MLSKELLQEILYIYTESNRIYLCTLLKDIPEIEYKIDNWFYSQESHELACEFFNDREEQYSEIEISPFCKILHYGLFTVKEDSNSSIREIYKLRRKVRIDFLEWLIEKDFN